MLRSPRQVKLIADLPIANHIPVSAGVDRNPVSAGINQNTASAGPKEISDSNSTTSSSTATTLSTSFSTPEPDAFLKQPQNDNESSSTDELTLTGIQDSPRLAPLRTPRSASNSSINSSDMDYVRSSNESFGKFNLGKVVLGSTSEAESDSSPLSPRGGVSALDIGELQPADLATSSATGSKKSAAALDLDISSDSRSSSQDPGPSSKSSSAVENRFLKKSSQEELRSQSETSLASHSSSKRSKSDRSKSDRSSVSRKAESRPEQKINPSQSRPQTAKNVAPQPLPISVQIDVKKREEEQRIEQELIQIQIALQEKRQERFVLTLQRAALLKWYSNVSKSHPKRIIAMHCLGTMN